MRLAAQCIQLKSGSSSLTFKIVDSMKMSVFIPLTSTLIAVYRTENAPLRDM
jgi:hypothetical protein